MRRLNEVLGTIVGGVGTSKEDGINYVTTYLRYVVRRHGGSGRYTKILSDTE